MKTKLLIRGAKISGVAVLLATLSGCATSPTAQRDSSGPVRYTLVRPTGKIPVDVYRDTRPPSGR